MACEDGDCVQGLLYWSLAGCAAGGRGEPRTQQGQSRVCWARDLHRAATGDHRSDMLRALVWRLEVRTGYRLGR